MLIARKKRKENIAEYVLYMWQLEDMIRAFNFDMDTLKAKIIDQYKIEDKALLQEVTEWYEGLIITMQKEGIQQQGHLQIVKNVVSDLADLHLQLIDALPETEYRKTYREALPNIQAFLKNTKTAGLKNEIEVCFYALYSLMLMRLKGEKISEETQKGMDSFSKLLSLLAQKYHLREKGKLDL